MQNINELLSVPNSVHDWKEVHNHFVTKRTRELFDAELHSMNMNSNNSQQNFSINIQLNKTNMVHLPALDGTKILTLCDSGSTVNLISEDLVKSSIYLSSLPVFKCPKITINNTSGNVFCDSFIEICFRLSSETVLFTTALLIKDFGSVKFLLSTNSMSKLDSILDLKDNVIKFRRKEFALRSLHFVKLQPNESKTITVKSRLPGSLKNTNMLCRSFMPYSKYFPSLFTLQFRRNHSIIHMTNPTNNVVTLKPNTVIAAVSLDLEDRFDKNIMIASHSHEDSNGNIAICSHDWDTCPIRKTYNNSMPSHTHYSENYHNFKQQNTTHTSSHTSTNTMSNAEKMKRYYSFDQSKMTTQEIYELKRFTFPYLEPDDVRLSLPDSVIIEKELDLHTDSVLTPSEREKVAKLFYDLRECLSIHDNPSVSSKRFVSLNPINLQPFYIKPYLTHPDEIKFAEKELKKLQLMGILRRGSSEFLSPLMLIRKSHSGQKLSKTPQWRAVANFQYLNKHLPDVQFSYPDVKHVLHKIGRSGAKIFTCLDLKQAFYSICLDPASIKYTTVCASPGSPSYEYLRLPQGLKVSPAYFTNLMNDIISELSPEDRDNIECIMDDAILFSSDFSLHCRVLYNFLVKLREFGLLVTINKVNCFRSSVTYMGLKLSSSNGNPTIKPLGSRIKSIQSLPQPISARGIKSFCGAVNYLSQFLSKLSELIKPINDILKEVNQKKKDFPKIKPLKEYQKGKGHSKNRSPNIQTLWQPIHTENFEKIKSLITKAPILHLPNAKGHFTLEVDSSSKHVGSCLYQEQGGKNVIIAFFSSVMPEPAKRYSATEIELCGLKKSIIHFKYLLKYCKFSVIMDHSALKRILGSKKQAKTNRIQKYLEELSDFSFDFIHTSGKNMFISDYLSRFSSPNYDEEPIPFLTNTKNITGSEYMALLDKACQFDYKTNKGLCSNQSYVMTRSQAKKQHVTLPPLFPHGIAADKPANTSEMDPTPPVDLPRRKRGRSRKQTEVQVDLPTQVDDPTTPIIHRPTQPKKRSITRSQPTLPIQLQVIPEKTNTRGISTIINESPDSNLINKEQFKPTVQNNDIPEVSEHVTPVSINKHFPPLKALFPEPITDIKVKTRRDVPKQEHIDKIMDLLHYKTQHTYKLPFSLEELRKLQRKDAYFSKYIQYLESNHLPSNETARRSIISESDYYALFGGILFRIIPRKKHDIEYKLTLCIPVDLAYRLFDIYHTGLCSGHQGINKCFYRLRQDFYIPNMYKHLYLYIMSCRICSARRHIPINEKPRAWADSVITDFSIFQSLSMDIKVMPCSADGYNYLLVLRCNHSRFIITDALKSRKAVEVSESIFQNVICQHGTNIEKIYCDLDTAFKNAVLSYLLSAFGIQITFCSVESHQSNPAERSIKSIGDLLHNYMSTFGNQWSSIHRLATLAVNTFPIAHLSNLSSYEIVYGRKPPVLTDIKSQADDLAKPKFFHYSDYMDMLNKRMKYIRNIAQKHHNAVVEKRRLEHGQSSRSLREFHEGDIIYCHFPTKSLLGDKGLSSKKFSMSFIGPMFIHSRYDKFMYTLATIDGVIIDQLFHVSRLKKGYLRLGKNIVVTNIYDYKKEFEKAQKLLKASIETDTNKEQVMSNIFENESHISEKKWYINASSYFNTLKDSIILTEQHQSSEYLSTNMALSEQQYTFHSSDKINTNMLCTISKARYKFGILQVFTHYTNDNKTIGIWISIPTEQTDRYITMLKNAKIRIIGSIKRYVDYLFDHVIKIFYT